LEKIFIFFFGVGGGGGGGGGGGEGGNEEIWLQINGEVPRRIQGLKKAPA